MHEFDKGRLAGFILADLFGILVICASLTNFDVDIKVLIIQHFLVCLLVSSWVVLSSWSSNVSHFETSSIDMGRVGSYFSVICCHTFSLFFKSLFYPKISLFAYLQIPNLQRLSIGLLFDDSFSHPIFFTLLLPLFSWTNRIKMAIIPFYKGLVYISQQNVRVGKLFGLQFRVNLFIVEVDLKGTNFGELYLIVGQTTEINIGRRVWRFLS